MNDEQQQKLDDATTPESETDGHDASSVPHVDASNVATLQGVSAWRRRTSKQLADCRVFQVRRDLSINPRDGREHFFYVIEATDWINVVPLTSDNKVVMIEQYRHGTEEVTLEIPGGMVDADETPRAAAARELFEETGYAAPKELIALGKTRPNPAIQNNWIHTFLAANVEFISAPAFDGTEHTAVRLVPLDDIPRLVADGTINHALVVVGFHRLSLHQRGLIE